MSFEDDPISSAAEGATKATLDWTSEKAKRGLKELIRKFKDKDLAFIEDIETINSIKEQRNTGEWDLFKQYIKSKESRVLFQMGLFLRKLEKEGKDFKPLKEKILNKYGIKGLHFAQFVQNGLFSKFIGNILDRVITPKIIIFEIEDLLNNIDKTVVFITANDKINQKASEISAKILSNSPQTFIVSSTGSAKKICKGVIDKVLPKIADYSLEEYESEDKRIYFLNRGYEIV